MFGFSSGGGRAVVPLTVFYYYYPAFPSPRAPIVPIALALALQATIPRFKFDP